MGWPQNAYVGQKVVRHRFAGPHEHIAPPLGETLTVSWVGVVVYQGEEFVVLDLVEHPSPREGVRSWQRGWAADFFRPVQDTRKSYQWLEALLDPTNHKDLEHVHPNSPIPELV